MSEQEEDISPSFREFYIKRDEVFISDSILAVLAARCSVGIVQVSTECIDKCAGPLLARLTRRRVEYCELVISAYNVEPAIYMSRHQNESGARERDVLYFGGKHATQHIIERRYPVQP